MAEKLNLLIIEPEKEYYNGTADIVTVNFTDAGQISFMAKHIDLVGNLAVSFMTVKDNGHVYHYAVNGGACRMDQKTNTLTIMANSIERADEIDKERALKSKEKAEQIMDNPESERDYKKAEARLLKALNRLNVCEL